MYGDLGDSAIFLETPRTYVPWVISLQKGMAIPLLLLDEHAMFLTMAHDGCVCMSQ